MDNRSYNVTEAIKTVKAVNMALESLEVKGRQNMDILLGSMQALERSINVIEAAFDEMSKPEVKMEVVPEEEAPTE